MQHAQTATATPTIEYGQVLARSKEGYTVQTAHGRYAARKAKSCLLAPEPGDSVLLSTDSLGACFILAILEGAQESSAIEHQGDLSLQVSGGSLQLTAERELSLASETVTLTAHQGNAALERISLLSHSVSAQCRTLELAADICRQSLRSLSQRLGSFFRATEGHEETQAGSSRSLVEDTRVVHCKSSVLMAEEDARIDADQIQLG